MLVGLIIAAAITLAYIGYVWWDEGWSGVKHLIVIPFVILTGIGYLFLAALIWIMETLQDYGLIPKRSAKPSPR